MDILVELNLAQKTTTRFLTAMAGFLAYHLIKDNTILSVALGAILAIMFRNTTTVYALSTTFVRDIITATRFGILNAYIFYLEKRKWSLARVFQQRCRKHPHKTCFIMDERKLTFKDVEDFSNKVGTYFKERGYGKGDCVALMMATRPEYAAIWLGLSKIGIITALINTNLKKDTLLHAIKVAKAKAIIVGTELVSVYEQILDQPVIQKMPLYQFSDEEQRLNGSLKMMKGACDFTAELANQRPKNLRKYISQCTHKDKLLYIYTSGTTGMPKAAIITSIRYIFMASGTQRICGMRNDDIIYNCLPLYHTAGGILGVGRSLTQGCTVVLRTKFSATNFWKDCIKYNATCAQYIGELCRYLLNSPARPEDTQHKLRFMYGNGLRAQIWSQFTTRFNIPNIGEVYGATEGNSNLANGTNQVGAIGFVPIIARKLHPIQPIRVDEESGVPIRNAQGLCIRCKPGETGLLIGKVDPHRTITAFQGYADEGESEKKLLRNVFKTGDVFFNSGDMVVEDILGYYYFKDRTGDTFRWRGENVATLEVEAIITNAIGLQDCVVYGVEIPHVEGRAGMAAIEDPDRKIDLENLSVGLRASLPAYAQPLFIRVMNQIPRTDTFKMKKRELMLQSFNINIIKEPLYYLNKDGVYRLLKREQYESLLQGSAGL